MRSLRILGLWVVVFPLILLVLIAAHLLDLLWDMFNVPYDVLVSLTEELENLDKEKESS
jgi:hypothetical protein